MSSQIRHCDTQVVNSSGSKQMYYIKRKLYKSAKHVKNMD